MAEIDRLSLAFASHDPDLFARVLGRAELDECESVIAQLPTALRAAVVARLPAVRVRQLLDSDRHDPGAWLVDAPFDDAVTLLSRIPRERRLVLVNGLKDRSRQRRLLRNQQFPLHSVGALVEDIPMRVSAQSSAPETLGDLRKLELEARSPMVVVDGEGKYIGVLDGWKLLMRSPATGTVKDFVLTVKAVRPETPFSAIATGAAWGSRSWLPVIDNQRRVLGAVTRERVIRAASQQAGGAPQRHDLLFDLLTDLVRLYEAVLLTAVARKGDG